MVYWSSDEVDHGDEGVDVPVSTGPGSGCQKKPIQALQSGIGIVIAPSGQYPVSVTLYRLQGLLYWCQVGAAFYQV